MNDKRKIRVNDVLYLKEFTIGDNDFDVNIILTNKENQAERYNVDNIPAMLQILEILGFKNPIAII